ncbi:ABC transporter permease [Sphingosinicella sp. CPCC 101087]|uniref:ABC transporter permease n=1 Tax=Sphingosinicella sp. CPCC 101087 TaxID=2497754 RepID=UPI00101D2E7A|nr:ABC transporter permease [Sphingosinicella sp. CPCC 101087]
MWRNYLTVGFRALTRNRTYAFINVFGLALGLAACLMILIYVRYETSYDRWLPDSERVFQVQSINVSEDNPNRVPQQGTHGVITESLAADFPQIEEIARVEGFNPVFLQEGEPVFVEMYLTDENFFRILQLPFLRGDPATALSGMDALVLSRSEAMNRFGSLDIIGRTVTSMRGGEQYSLRVTGIFEDIPRNSHMPFRALGRISEQEKADCGWGCVNGFVYLKLRPGADAEAINDQLQAWERRNIPPVIVGGQQVSEGDLFDWHLVNVRDVHLSGAEGELDRPGNDRRTIVTFAIVALLILAMASINFVNLATARASQRAREVALRKVLGANRRQLVFQFLGESLLITGLAMLIALAMVELGLPYLAAFLDSDLEIQYLGVGGILLPVAGLFLVVGFAGGLYPAFYLSRFQPAAVLKANKSTAEPLGTGRLRNLLVVGQFAVSIGLIICTIVVYAQTRFAQTTDLGFEREGLIQVANMNRAEVIPQTETLMREIGRIEGVEGVAGTSITVATGNVTNTNALVPGRAEPLLLGNYSVHPDFFQTMRVPLLAGRTLSLDQARDRLWLPWGTGEDPEPAMRELVQRGLNIVVNRLAAEQMGYADPQAAIGRQVRLNVFPEEVGLLPATIVGVVENSRFRSLRESVEPSLFFDRGIYRSLAIRYRSSNPEAVRQNVAQVWKRLVADVPFEGEYADDQLAELYATDAARGQAFAGFAGLAVVIACLGLFGLAAFTAERRTREIGIRKVFGARSRDIVRLLAWQFSKPVIVANLVAWPAAWWVMRDWLNSFDVRIDLGPGPFLIAGLIALAIAIGTVSGHALRVSRTNPINALRYE